MNSIKANDGLVARQRERLRIETQVAEFLAKGGAIERLPGPGEERPKAASADRQSWHSEPAIWS